MTLLTNLGAGAGALIAIFTLFGMFIKYAIVKPIKAYIDKMTYPIQPFANGSKSLPDLINTVDDVKAILIAHIAHHDTHK